MSSKNYRALISATGPISFHTEQSMELCLWFWYFLSYILGLISVLWHHKGAGKPLSRHVHMYITHLIDNAEPRNRNIFTMTKVFANINKQNILTMMKLVVHFGRFYGRRFINMSIRYTLFACPSQHRRSKPEIIQAALLATRRAAYLWNKVWLAYSREFKVLEAMLTATDLIAWCESGCRPPRLWWNASQTTIDVLLQSSYK